MQRRSRRRCVVKGSSLSVGAFRLPAGWALDLTQAPRPPREKLRLWQLNCRCHDCHVIAKIRRHDASPAQIHTSHKPVYQTPRRILAHRLLYAAFRLGEPTARSNGMVRPGQLAHSCLFAKPHHHIYYLHCRIGIADTTAQFSIQADVRNDESAHLPVGRTKWSWKDGIRDTSTLLQSPHIQ
jgi:hypothetical protein